MCKLLMINVLMVKILPVTQEGLIGRLVSLIMGLLTVTSNSG